MSLRGFGGYGIGPRAPTSSPTPPGGAGGAGGENNGDSFGGFAKSSFLGTLSVPLDFKVNMINDRLFPIFNLSFDFRF